MPKFEEGGKLSGFIDKETGVSGDMEFKNSFRIDGKFKGKILSGTTLVIGETGVVNADVQVKTVTVNGRLKGSIIAKDMVEILSKGRVTGKIVCAKLIIEDGAFFQGSCQMDLNPLENKEKVENGKIYK
jgi:cytoskeletal protein CcmA (bactofilin family)